MRNKIFIALIFIVLLSITAVNAADDATSDIISVDDEELILDEAIDDDVSSANDNFDEEILSAENDLEPLGADTGTYSGLSSEIGSGGNIVLAHNNYIYDSGSTIEISLSNSDIDGNGAVIDMAGSNIQAFKVTASGVTIRDLTIKNANYISDGGAIYFSKSGTVENCNFTDNIANIGGAIYFAKTGSVTNCNFANNTAEYGGAIEFEEAGSVTNCNFTDNTATNFDAGAIYFLSEGNVTNCNFVNNTAEYSGGAIEFERAGSVTNCNFADNTATNGGAIFSYDSGEVTADTCIFKTASDTTDEVNILPPTLNVDNFTTTYGSGDKITFYLMTNSGIPVDNGNISISVYYQNNDSLVGNYSCLSGDGWAVNLPVNSYYAIYNTEYAGFTQINRTITIGRGTEFSIDDIECDYGETPTLAFTLSVGATGTIKYFLDDGTFLGELDVSESLTLPKLDVGSYTLIANYSGDNYFPNATATAALTVNKAKAEITPSNSTIYLFVGDSSKVEYGLNLPDAKGITFTSSNPDVVSVDSTGQVKAISEGTATITLSLINANYEASPATVKVVVSKKATSLTASAVTATYSVSKNLVATLKDKAGKAISGVKVTIKINGKTYTKTTDKNGQVKLGVSSLIPKTYTATITYAGNSIYNKATKSVKVTVKKATPKMTAKAKTFKIKVKTKKYTITLKNNKGKVMKNTKVTLKVNKKTFTAKTNKKGVATFKITNLKKKGKYTAVIKYAGSKYYNKVTKKPKITIKK